MKQLSLLKLKIKNFRSYIDETIQFPQTTGLLLLTGRNDIQPKLGANGCGKTATFDALCWCLYGTSVKGAKTSSIVSWGATQTIVLAEVSINNIVHVIKRFGPPMKIELDNKPVTQDEIDSLLGLSRDRFLHSVIFGQAVPLFPDLSIPERGLLLDEVLSLNIWQLATEAASKKCVAIEKELNKKKEEISFLEGKLSGLPSDKQLKKQSSDWIDEHRKKLLLLQAQSDSWQEKQELHIKELQKQEESWRDEILEIAEQKAREIESLEAEAAPLIFEIENAVVNPFSLQISAVESKLDEAETTRDTQTKILHQCEHEFKSCNDAEKLWLDDVCPLCTQKITENKKKHELDCVKKLKVEVTKKKELAEELHKTAINDVRTYQKQLQELRAIAIREDEKIKSKKREVDRINNQIRTLEIEGKRVVRQLEDNANPYTKQLTKLESNPYTEQIKNCKETTNPFTQQLSELKSTKSKLINEYAVLETDFKKTESTMIATEYWKHGFKRIRLFFVNQVLAALQIEIQSAISALGLENWHIELSTETENTTGGTKLGVQLHVRSPVSEGKWEVFSGGESQRLRVAIALGLGSLIQRSSGSFWNFSVWDEPTSWLSPEGIEDLLECFSHYAERKTVLIIDHRALQYSAFQEVWEVVKTENGSKVYKIAG